MLKICLLRNHRKGIADLTATSSKDLLFKLRNFEVNRAKVAEERQNYGMQEVCSSAAQFEGKEGEFPLGEGKERELARKGKNKNVPNITSAQSKIKEGEIATTGINKPLTRLTATQGKLKEGDFGTKGMTKKDNLDEMGNDSKKEMIASNSKCKEGQHLLPKRIKTSVPKNLDFSFLQSTFDAIRGKANNMPPTMGQQQMNKNQGPQGEASGAAMNVTDSTKGDSTYVLQRKLDAIHKRNNTVLSTSVTQQRSLENSAQSVGYQGQHNNVQLTQEKIQERQEEFSLPSHAKKKKTRGHTSCANIYGRTMEQWEEVTFELGGPREEVTFELGGPVGPTAKSVSNLTSFAGTLGRNKRFVSLSYTNWHAVP
ncbi:hypothetical protein PIB30_029476 [Stylosanthes scabra]|uniref:Uncharacterized protein n=1 Tax=Stylosanthes scabra TaxID=79078 RepID=A0ABU6QBS7_9FABA|nr:hypothetical protein [Stylosanthes scabra]